MKLIGSALALLGRNHMSDHRLFELASADGPDTTPGIPTPDIPSAAPLPAPPAPTAPATSAEQAHLDACPRCRGLLVGYRRTEAVLSGAWADRPVRSRAETFTRMDPVGGERVGRIGSRGAGDAGGTTGRGKRRGAVALLGAAALIVGVVATAGLLGLRSDRLAPAGPRSGTPGIPAGTRIVANLPIGRYATFGWSPDGAHLLVTQGYEEAGSTVYDRFGNAVAKFGQFEGWLDSTHLIGGDGYVANIDADHMDGPKSNGGVVANGHGSAAIVVGVPACVCDPLVDWYRDGNYIRANETVSPLGWSPDGRLLLRGRFDDSRKDAAFTSWAGAVDVTDFATGRVLATVPAVSGEMAFNPSATRLAAESGGDLEILDIGTGAINTVPGARLLGWWNDDAVYYLTAGNVIGSASATVKTEFLQGPPPTEWPIPSSTGPDLFADSNGSVTRIVTADQKTTLLDLTPASLVVPTDLTASYPGVSLWQSPWSPDGRMIALETADKTSLVLISVDPSRGGAVGTALPTPIGSAAALTEKVRTELPGRVAQLVSDTKRNMLWFLSGDPGGPIQLNGYDPANETDVTHSISGTTYNADHARLAIGPDGRLWIGAGDGIVVYDPDTDRQTSVSLPADADVQTDPKTGKADPWVAGVAFDGNGNALLARNWVRSLLRVDSSLKVLPDRLDISDGFPMTGGLAVAGGRAYVIADPTQDFGFSADATGVGKRADAKIQAHAIVAVGNRILAAGTPPSWLDANGGGQMVAPVMDSADLVAAGPDGTSILYDSSTGQAQWRDKDGKVSLQAAFGSGKAPHVTAIALDAHAQLWFVEENAGSYAVVLFDVAK